MARYSGRGEEAKKLEQANAKYKKTANQHCKSRFLQLVMR